MKNKKHIFILFILALFSITMQGQSVEFTVKALLIEKIAKLTEWETGGNGEYFIIGILGESPFNGELEKLAQKTKIKNKPVKIKYLSKYRKETDCNILFICASEANDLPEIIDILTNRNVLLISDTEGFCKKGVHINFYFDDETIKYEVNPTALKNANLSVDMQLLNYGKIIK